MTSIFTNIRLFTKRLRAVFISDCNIYDSIVVVIALNLIHKDFDIKILSLVKTSNKTISKI